MNSGGRRRPLGPRLRGLSVFALVFAVLGLWLGAVDGGSPLDGHAVPSLSQSVAVAHVVSHPVAQVTAAVPAGFVILVMVLSGVLICARRQARPVRVRSERRQGRAPPGASSYR